MTMWTEYRTRLGRRGSFLLLLGLCWVGVGVGIFFGPATTEQGAQYLPHEHLPHWLRLVLWAGTGLVAIGYCLKEPPGTDTIGFVTLSLMPLERVASYFWGWFLYLLNPPHGYGRGLIQGAIWCSVVGAIFVVAGWAEPENLDRDHAS
jgi:hypothetical protein